MILDIRDEPCKKIYDLFTFGYYPAILDPGAFLLFEDSPKKLSGKTQIFFAKSRYFLVEPRISGWKFLVEPRSLKMDTLHGTRNLKILQTRQLTGKPSSW